MLTYINMMKKLNLDIKYLIALAFLSILAITLTWGHHGHAILDCGRELYIPTEILKGKVLYKDIFDIYGPFAYFINALLFKIFGTSVNVLYTAGSLCAITIVESCFLLGKRFVSDSFGFSVGIFAILTGILSFNLFNFVFPYSFAMLYGITFFLISTVFLSQYNKTLNNQHCIYLASFFAGLSIISKYEFFLFGFVILFMIFSLKEFNKLQKAFSFLCLILMPISVFLFLIAQGLTFSNIILQAFLLIRLLHSKTLTYFYTISGIYFSKGIPFTWLKSIIEIFLVSAIYFFGLKRQNKFIKNTIIIISLILLVIFTKPEIFGFLPLATVILAFVFKTKLLKNKKLLFLFFAVLSISLKVFWLPTTVYYGVFFICPLFITAIAILKCGKNENENLFKFINIFIITTGLILFIKAIPEILSNNSPLKTSKGTIYTTKEIQNSTLELIKFIKETTTKNDTIAIYPEGAFINFATERKSDDYFLSLIPIYVEMYDEKVLIKHFSREKPKYIIFNNIDTRDYYYNQICNNYAINFCNFVNKNYSLKKRIGNNNSFIYTIYENK